MADIKIEFSIAGQQATVVGSPDETLLEAAIRNDLNPPYSCMEGVCSACQAKVLQGEVEAPEDLCLDQDQVKQGFVLTCQAKVKNGCSYVSVEF
jgi:ring-1,2-phenylacetyl-CoA epoxidase subunit PaaE